MDTIKELRKHVEVLEKFLKEEKKFRDVMNNTMKWERERNSTECKALREITCRKMQQAERMAGELERSREELLKLQAKYNQLIETLAFRA